MKSDTFRNDILKLIFNATAIANISDNAAASPLTNLHVALHSADPGNSGDQTTSEVAYTGYGRVAVARTSGGWTVTANNVSPVATIGFGACTAGSATATWFSVGVASSGASKILRRGVLGSKLGPFTAIVAGNVITIPGLTGVAVNDRVVFAAVDSSTLPTGITAGTSYFVITLSTNDITISLTQGGAAVTLSSTGDGLVYKSTPIAITSGVTPQLGTGSTITEE
jgi:hypothetical protein